MISVEQAKGLIAKNTVKLIPVTRPLANVHNHVLAADVFAICDIPAFEQSSMDGYAIKFTDRNQPLELAGEMAAGTSKNIEIKSGQASRIFTGAPLPTGSDTVVMQEKIAMENGKIICCDENLKLGSNVRNKGSEIQTGNLAMTRGNYLSPAAIGFLAGIGITEVAVYPIPTVAVILTGKELVKPGEPLGFGKVYEANSFSLKAAMLQAGIKSVEIFEADDDLAILTNILGTALAKSDVVLLTGGVSVGDYDFVLEASRLCGVEKIFHKVKQKPGKPLFFGKLGQKLIFGLPGNPSSVLSCFYNYVLPALSSLSGKTNPVKEIEAELTNDYNKATGLTHFLKANHHMGKVTALGAQESFRLSSFAQANCLISLNEEKELFKKGDIVKILLLPE
jgi:molybdopterin molybdotransferase